MPVTGFHDDYNAAPVAGATLYLHAHGMCRARQPFEKVSERRAACPSPSGRTFQKSVRDLPCAFEFKAPREFGSLQSDLQGNSRDRDLIAFAIWWFLASLSYR
jgi:hypothetical protein